MRKLLPLTFVVLILSLSCARVEQTSGLAHPTSDFKREVPSEVAATLAQQVYSLADLEEIARTNSPEIRRAQASIDAARGVARQVGLLPNPDLEVIREDFTASDADDGVTGVAIVQPIAASGRLAAARRAESARIRAAEQELEATRRRVLRDVGQAYIEVIHRRTTALVQMELLGIAEETLRLAEAKPGADGDVARARAEVTTGALEVTRYMAEQVFVSLELQHLLGLDEFLVSRVRGQLLATYEPDELGRVTGDSVEQHPEVLAALARVEAERLGGELARREAFGDVRIRASASYDDRVDETTFGAGLAIPLPLFNRNQGRMDQARAMETFELETAEQARHRLDAEFSLLRQRINETDTLANDYAMLVAPDQLAAFEAVRSAYAAGEAALVDVLDAQRAYFATRLLAVSYQRDLSIAHVRLRYFMAGGDLPDLFQQR